MDGDVMYWGREDNRSNCVGGGDRIWDFFLV